MKFQKWVDPAKAVDTYTIQITHEEANEAFKRMSPLERGMIHDLQESTRVSTALKVLLVWARKIEEGKDASGTPDGGGKDEG